MANTYLTPGVYIQENLNPLPQNSTGPSSAVGAFVGLAPQGPTSPTLVTSWQQYATLFGGFSVGYLMPYAVYLFFANGGSSCYIVRAVNANAVASSVQLQDISSPTSPHPGLQVNAIAPGAWGNGLNVAVTVGATADRFDLTVRYGGLTNANLVEKFQSVSNNPADSRYVVSVVNSPVSGSNYINVTDLKITQSGWVYNSAVDGLAAVDPAQLAGGSDGTGTPDLVGATSRLDAIPGTLTINLPGISAATTINSVLSYCDNRGTAFLVIDGPQAAAGSTSAQVAANYVNLVSGSGAITADSNGALYAPWLICNDPSSALPGAMRFLPPGGAIVGQICATDTLRGVQKAPAGIANALNGVLDLEARFQSADTDSLNSHNVNAVRIVPGVGMCIMGARTLKSGYPDKYVNVRRTLQMLRNDLVNVTRFAVFENNSSALWSQVNSVVTQYLTTLMQQGVFAGSTPQTAFSVTCDATNNPPNQVSAGILNITVAVALQQPAEFIIITISQFESGSSSSVSS